MTRAQLVNAMTVDVEDYFHVSAFADVARPRAIGRSMESRVERNTHRLLELFDEHGVRITFFVLGWVAERAPELITRTASPRGTRWRVTASRTSSSTSRRREVFRDETHAVEGDARGSHRRGACAVIAPRAIRSRATRCGRSTSSRSSASTTTRASSRSGTISTACRTRRAQPLTVAPAPAARSAADDGARVRAATAVRGRRLFPAAAVRLFRWALRRVNREGLPAVFYHASLGDRSRQPRIEAPWRSRFRHYTNLHRTAARLEALLNDFRWATHGGSLPDAAVRAGSTARDALARSPACS